MVAACDVDLAAQPPSADAVLAGDDAALARAITVLEAGPRPRRSRAALRDAAAAGTGAGARHHRHRRLGQVAR